MRRDPRVRNMPILVLSARAEEADRVLGLETGADDYLVKPFGPRELVARFRALLRRVETADKHEASVLRDGDFEMNFERHSASLGGAAVPFTASEYRLVALLALQPPRVFTRDEILKHLGGSESDDAVTERTVDVHINAIRRKLAAGNGRIVTVRGVGYKFKPEEIGGAAAPDR
jgi:DNA-binding response OmpR family regulator